MSHPIESLRRQPDAAADAEPLAGFQASRRPIVLSYCTWVCDDERAEEAVDAAFARLERELDAASGNEPIKVDRLLREAVREAAAERVPAAGERSSRVRRIGGRDHACELMPTLLAARASGRLSDADDERVARHLTRCASCRELERRHVAAERAYDAFLQNGVPEVEALTRVDDAPEADAALTREAVEPEAVEPEAEPGVVGPEAAGPEAVEPQAVEPEAVEPEAALLPPAREPATRARSPWLARAALGLLIAGIVTATAITLSSGSGESDAPAPADRRAAPAPPPAEPGAAAEPAEPPRNRAAERLEALGDRMLGPGATGRDVRTLQRLLGVPRTGAYDDATTEAVLAFQTANGLNPDGNAGPETKRLIARRPPASAR